MDVPEDFLIPEFFYLILFKKKNLIIRPLILKKKLNILTTYLDLFYQIETIDPEFVNDPDCLISIFNQYEDVSEKNVLYLIENMTPKLLDIIQNGMKDQFIAIEKDTKQDYSNCENCCIWNKKRNEFDYLDMSIQMEKETKEFQWAQFFITKIKKEGRSSAINYLTVINDAVEEIWELAGEFNMVKYYHITSVFNELERYIIRRLCEELKNISLEEIIPINEEEEFRKIHDSQGLSLDLDDSLQIFNPNPKLHIKKKKEDIENSTLNFINHEEQKPKCKNQIPYENVLSELYACDNAELRMNFDLTIGEFLVQNCTLTSPEEKYEYLRSHQWVSGIPHEFFLKLFINYLKGKLKVQEISHKGLWKFMQGELLFFKTGYEAFHPEQFGKDLNNLYTIIEQNPEIQTLIHKENNSEENGKLPFRKSSIDENINNFHEKSAEKKISISQKKDFQISNRNFSKKKSSLVSGTKTLNNLKNQYMLNLQYFQLEYRLGSPNLLKELQIERRKILDKYLATI